MNLLVLGPAGSGKTLFTSAFGSYLSGDFSVRYVNLDPGVERLPYEPDFDVRKKFTLRGIMRQEGLGPNGAMLRAVDALADLTIPRLPADFVIVDTPGQLEPFVFREAGPALSRNLGSVVCIFLMDCTSPVKTFPSLLLYSLAAQFSLGVDAVNCLNKADLLDDRSRRKISEMVTDPRGSDGFSKDGVRGEMNRWLARMAADFLPSQRPCFVSARTTEGFDQLLDLIRETGCSCGDLT